MEDSGVDVINYVNYNIAMTAIQGLRRARGLSQRQLARRAGLSYKTVQLLERGGHDPRWSTLAKLAGVLGLAGPEVLVAARAAGGHRSAGETAERIAAEGEDSWKLRLFEFVDAFRRAPESAMVERAPGPSVGRRVLALIAATVESLCAAQGLPAPWWCAGVPPLSEPWFVAGVESLKAAALAESPVHFRRRNIFVLGNFLSRA